MKLHTVGPNQTQLSLANGVELFFSYNTPVAAFIPEMGFVKTDKHYSVTTSKHINQWTSRTERVVPQKLLDDIANSN